MSPKCRRDFRGLNPLSHKELNAQNFEFGTRHTEGGRSDPPLCAHFLFPPPTSILYRNRAFFYCHIKGFDHFLKMTLFLIVSR